MASSSGPGLHAVPLDGIFQILTGKLPLPKGLRKDELRHLREMRLFAYTLEEALPGLWRISRKSRLDGDGVAAEWFVCPTENGLVPWNEALHGLQQLSIPNYLVANSIAGLSGRRNRQFFALFEYLRIQCLRTSQRRQPAGKH